MKYILALCILIFNLLIANENYLEIGFVYWKKQNTPEKYNAYVYGIEKAIKEINRKKIFPYPLKLVLFNEKGKISESIKIAKEIAKKENMIAVIGFSNSKRAIKAIKYVSQANIPIISSAGSKKIFLQDINKVFFTTNFGIEGEIEYLKQFIKLKHYDNFIFISKRNDAYSDEYYNDVSKILPKHKRIFVDNSLKIDIEKLKKLITKNTLIIISIDVKNNAKLAKILRKNEIKNDIFLGRGGIVGDEFYKSGGYGLKNIYELSTLLAGVSNDSILKFKEDNKKFFKNPKNVRYLEYAAYGYDVMQLITEAYKRALKEEKINKKNVSVKKIRELIKKGLTLITEKQPYEGITTTFSFNKDRIGGKLIPQYILKSTGLKPSLYKTQFIYQNGKLVKVPTLYTNIDIKSISIDNQEASEYTIEMMITLISEANISLNDLEFENILISNASFKPAIYYNEFIIPSISKEKNMNVKIYKVKGRFSWDNTIEDFPFDSQKLPILIKPKNPVKKNFITFFISDIEHNLNNIDISGWKIDGGYAGFKKGFYEYIDSDLKKHKKYYYRSSFTIEVTRDATSSALKFILPLAIVIIITIILFALPDNAASDKVGSATNMLITVAALYFTYATLVDVDYITFVDKLYISSLFFVLIVNVIFILRQRYYHSQPEKGGFEEPCLTGKGIKWIFNQAKNDKKIILYNLIYAFTFFLSIVLFIWAVTHFLQKMTS